VIFAGARPPAGDLPWAVVLFITAEQDHISVGMDVDCNAILHCEGGLGVVWSDGCGVVCMKSEGCYG
jgi:hypothetical protein